jgi:hypothetical protein
MALPSTPAACRRVQLPVVPEDALFVERDAPLRGKIGRDARPVRDPLMERNATRHLPFNPCHRAWERIAQSVDDPEQRQVHIAERAAKKIGSPGLLDYAFEIIQEFRCAVFQEID